MTSRSWVGAGSLRASGIGWGSPSRGPPAYSLDPLLFMAVSGWDPAVARTKRGKKKPPRLERRRGKSLISDQSPRGARSDETMTAEDAATTARAALAGRLIDGRTKCLPKVPVKPMRPPRRLD